MMKVCTTKKGRKEGRAGGIEGGKKGEGERKVWEEGGRERMTPWR